MRRRVQAFFKWINEEFVQYKYTIPRWAFSIAILAFVYIGVKSVFWILHNDTTFYATIFGFLIAIWFGQDAIYWMEDRYRNLRARIRKEPVTRRNQRWSLRLKRWWNRPRVVAGWKIALLALSLIYAVFTA